MSKPLLSISLDLDDQWTYLKTHGDPAWETYPTYLDYAIPRILDFLDKKNLKITFFIVAQDAAFHHNRKVLKEIVDRGHDIGSHTFHHDPWLHLYTEEQIDRELELAEQHITKVTGVKPVGFRGPGFSFSSNVLKVLAKRGYMYDASTFPNILNPLARMYFLWSSKMSAEEKKQREGLFGSWKDGLRPIKPYYWNINSKSLLEIPVTTMPIFRIPFHTSYILFLSTYSPSLALSYLKSALILSKATKVSPSVLLHPLDFIGCDDTEALSFFPAMKVESQKKIYIMNKVIDIIKNDFSPVTMQEHANHLLHQDTLPQIDNTLEVA